MKAALLSLAVVALLISTTGQAQTKKPFKYATLPDKAEWTVKLKKPPKVQRQRIQHITLPVAICKRFPIPGFRCGGAMAMERPGSKRSGYFHGMSRPGGYGMDTEGCITEGLLKQVKYFEKNSGISGGQYSYYQRVKKIKDEMLYNPRHYGFLINYRGTYLDITFPSRRTMHVRKLKEPDFSKIPHCGPNGNWRCRFEDCD